ncbi:SMP-30/gluconolactonase/LRE family protein [Compostibacter hankyongensis]|uniref:SMP-30/gluconolactonase/LRE family protein n=1 Tax=Compostibacter hankyongensis TaxID=1007089 RepID=A0ABP8G5G7_9BACT
MKLHFLLPGFLLLAACGSQPRNTADAGGDAAAADSLFRSSDLTAENTFSTNIEGPAVYRDSLFVVNYQHDGTLAYVSPEGKGLLWVSLPDSSTGNSIKFDAAGNMYVADFKEHNILKVDRNKKVSVFCHNDAFNQPNDICRSSRGWILASDPNWKDSTGQLWRIDVDGKATRLAAGMGTTNGLELSPDEKRLYVNESAQRRIWQFDIDTAGNISNKRPFTDFSDFGLDGMHCDKQGNLYVCRYGKGVIAVFDPAGKLLREIPLKGKNCSNLVFGGPDGRTVYVTLQDRKMLEQFRTDIPGKDF